MKIAIVSEDGKTISQHFGRATQYVVVSAEGDKVTGKETRPKVGHRELEGREQVSPGQQGHGCGCHEVHGYDPSSAEKHGAMASNIKDCSALLAGGMGWGAYESLKSYNIKPVVTDVESIDQAIKLYLEGKLPNLMERLH